MFGAQGRSYRRGFQSVAIRVEIGRTHGYSQTRSYFAGLGSTRLQSRQGAKAPVVRCRVSSFFPGGGEKDRRGEAGKPCVVVELK